MWGQGYGKGFCSPRCRLSHAADPAPSSLRAGGRTQARGLAPPCTLRPVNMRLFAQGMNFSATLCPSLHWET